MSTQSYRYAIYFCPKPQTTLGRFGYRWLESAEIATSMGLAEDDYLNLTQSPRRYGFHGTLKPPFRLATKRTPDMLIKSVEALVKSLSPVQLRGFNVNVIGSFIAMMPISPSDGLSNLANRCVMELDEFRAPPTADELARRRQDKLSRAQDQLLKMWGYPYVLNEFRFHLTLTSAVEHNRRDSMIAGLVDAAGDALCDYSIDDICLMVEPTSGAPFELLRRLPLGA